MKLAIRPRHRPIGAAQKISRGAAKFTGTGAGEKSVELYPAEDRKTLRFAATDLAAKVAEAGVKNVDVYSWQAVAAPKGLPADLKAKFGDQVRLGIAHNELKVRIGASHGGVSLGEDGASHQMIEDIARQ